MVERRATADVLALSHLLIPLGWVGACCWLLAAKNNPLTIFNSCRPFREQSIDAFLPVAKGLQRRHYFIDIFFSLQKLRDESFNNPYLQVTLATFITEIVLASV